LSPTANEAAAGPDDLLVAGAATLGIQLGVNAVASFRAYREDLLRWSERMNLTALATAVQIVQQGFLDSLACAPLLPTSSRRVIDIGSGAGFPAIPLALVKPGLEFTLVESSRKKVTFLRHVIRRLRLTLVQIRPNRVEALLGESGMIGTFDVALARAVAPLADAGRLVLPFLRPAGIFLAQTGPAEHVDDAVRRLARGGFEAIGERVVPAEFGKPGRRILTLRRSSTPQ
jgi:16S rRNA (guanine527-N7)-methyltransferase